MKKQYLVIHHTVGPAPTDNRYHALIHPDGSWRHCLDIHAAGAATYGSNSCTINIALVGNFEETKPTKQAIDRLVQVLCAWTRKTGISSSNIVSHGWIGQNLANAPRYGTACCGRHLISELESIRKRVDAYGR